MSQVLKPFKDRSLNQIPVQDMPRILMMFHFQQYHYNLQLQHMLFVKYWRKTSCCKPLAWIYAYITCMYVICMSACTLLFHDCFQDGGGICMPAITQKLGTLYRGNASRDWWRILSGGPEPWLGVNAGHQNQTRFNCQVFVSMFWGNTLTF